MLGSKDTDEKSLVGEDDEEVVGQELPADAVLGRRSVVLDDSHLIFLLSIR